MSHGISKYEIEKILKDINNEDIHDSFSGVFSSNCVKKFELFEELMS